jgi:hypothetical protein
MKESFIRQYKNQFPDELCEKLINILEDGISKNVSHAGTAGRNESDSKLKDSTDLDLKPGIDLEGVNIELFREIYHFLYGPVGNYINSYIVSPAGEKNYIDNIEDILDTFVLIQAPRLKVYRSPDQGYHAWHQDWGLLPEQARRLIVGMVYLNDVEEGGETGFYHQGLKIKAEKGKLVIFPPYFTHMHKGFRPISNDKYICNFYIGVSPDKG